MIKKKADETKRIVEQAQRKRRAEEKNYPIRFFEEENTERKFWHCNLSSLKAFVQDLESWNVEKKEEEVSLQTLKLEEEKEEIKENTKEENFIVEEI